MLVVPWLLLSSSCSRVHVSMARKLQVGQFQRQPTHTSVAANAKSILGANVRRYGYSWCEMGGSVAVEALRTCCLVCHMAVVVVDDPKRGIPQPRRLVEFPMSWLEP